MSRGRLALRIVAAGCVLGILFGIATQFTPLSALQDPGLANVSFGVDVGPGLILLLNIVNWAFLFMVWQVLYFGALALRQYRTAELRESELARALQLAELRLLKSQLNPHFLFNALNAVRALIAEDPPRAQDAVTRLANTLRYTLSSAQDELVTLEQELEIVQDYLGIESLRLEDRLQHRLRRHRRRAPGAHPGHAAADRGGECHQARHRGAAERAACSGSTASCVTARCCSKSRTRARPSLRAIPAKGSDCATPQSGCACCSAVVPASTSTCRSRRGPRRGSAFPSAHEGPDRR